MAGEEIEGEPSRLGSGLEELPASEDQRFFRSLEQVFVRLRGAPLLLSPADWQVASGWRRRGIPLAVIEPALEELFARRRESGRVDRINSLRYCASAVEKAWREMLEAGVAPAGASTPTAPPSIDTREQLRRLAAAVGDVIPDAATWRDQLQALSGGAEEVERRLTALERRLLDSLLRGLSDDERRRLEREAHTAAAVLGERVPEAERAAAVERLVRQALRRRFGLPVLSLFSRLPP